MKWSSGGHFQVCEAAEMVMCKCGVHRWCMVIKLRKLQGGQFRGSEVTLRVRCLTHPNPFTSSSRHPQVLENHFCSEIA